MEFRGILHLSNMIRILSLILALVFVVHCNAQLNVSGQLLNSNRSAISNVQILSEQGAFLGKSAKDGTFNLELKTPQKITFTHIEFEPYELTVNNSTTGLVIILETKEVKLPEVSVTAALPEVVYADESYHVADYQFAENGIYVLTYSKGKMLRKEAEAGHTILAECQIILLDDDLKVKAKSVFFKNGVSLHLDSYDQLFLKCTDQVFFVYEEHEELFATEMDKEDFTQAVEPLVLGEEELKIYHNFDETFPEFSYYIQLGEEELETFYTITDSVLMHTFRAQYRNLGPRDKLNAYRTELKTGIDKEIISGYMAGFHHSILFSPPYAPIFRTDSGFLIVDVTNSSLEYFAENGALQRTKPFILHEKPRQTGWKNLITQDQENHEIYLVFEKHGIARLELMENGTLNSEHTINLFYKYPKNIKVKDGYVYYLYRPFESSQKHYLYKEKVGFSQSHMQASN